MISNFDKAILGIAQAYGPTTFWLQNLNLNSNPDATWRALLLASALLDKAVVHQIPLLLESKDSRVRAWSCYYLSAIQELSFTDQLFMLTHDPSPRVRFHARQALVKLHACSEKEINEQRAFMHVQFKILVSDDSLRGRKQMANLLNQVGFPTELAGTETDTISMAQKIQPQVIITDNQKGTDNLSGLNMSWDICRDPLLREVIIIMLTADEIEPMFIWNGGDYFINKFRFNGNMLIQALQQYMS